MNFEFNCRFLKGEDKARVERYTRLLFDVMVGSQPSNTNVIIRVCGRMKEGRDYGLTLHNPRSSKMQWYFVNVGKHVLMQSEASFLKVLIHEFVHCRQFGSGELDSKRKYAYWKGERYITKSGVNPIREVFKLPFEEYKALPWEQEAEEHENRVYAYLVATTILTSIL